MKSVCVPLVYPDLYVTGTWGDGPVRSRVFTGNETFFCPPTLTLVFTINKKVKEKRDTVSLGSHRVTKNGVTTSVGHIRRGGNPTLSWILKKIC